MSALELLLLCPDCPPVRAARALVAADDLGVRALQSLLPFAVTGALVAWIGRRADRLAARRAARAAERLADLETGPGRTAHTREEAP